MLTSKIRWIGALALVFILLVATNLADRSSFQGMSNSVGSIYEDRLVAKSLLYDMRSIVATKQVALANEDVTYLSEGFRSDAVLMRELLSEFAQTELAVDEEREFADMQAHYTTLEGLEEQLSGTQTAPSVETAAALEAAHHQLVANLEVLSHIQLSEGQRERFTASRALRTVDIMTQIEVVLLGVIAFLIVGLILFWPSKAED